MKHFSKVRPSLRDAYADTLAQEIMAKYRPMPTHDAAVDRFLKDVGEDSVKLYSIDEFQAGELPDVFPVARMEKCTHAVVALSACEPDQRDYMLMCPYRVDQAEDGSGMVWDIDPMVVAFDSDSMEPQPIAVLGDHQKFEGRTTDIDNIAFSEVSSTVQSLSADFVTTEIPMGEIPDEVASAMHHMAGYYRRHVENPES